MELLYKAIEAIYDIRKCYVRINDLITDGFYAEASTRRGGPLSTTSSCSKQQF